MASCLNNHNEGPDPNAKPSTTFVQADPCNFRSVVQKLTGATTLQQHFTSTHKLPISNPSRHPKQPGALCEVGQHISVDHKLHVRRKTGRKLEITVARDGKMAMSSPVSTLDGRGSPRTPMEEEEKAIAEKRYYLHPSPIRGSAEPQLLVLFPLNSPKYESSCSS